MARKLLKRFLPDPEKIRNNPSLQFLGDVLHDPNLFHMNRRSVSVAFFLGIFLAFTPLPMQMAIAAACSLVLRCNLPIAVALVWITNPVTIPVIFFATYQLGRWLLQSPPVTVSLEFSWSWLANEFALIWKPLLVGSLLSGVVLGALGYITIQVLWRWQVSKNWKLRKQKRQESKNSNPDS